MNWQNRKNILLIIFSLVIAGILGYLGYQNYQLKQEKAAIEEELSKTKAEFSATSKNLLGNIDAIKQILVTTQDERNNFKQELFQERDIVDSMEAQVRSMTDAVGTLQKLSGIDLELLKKYSKVYFLNENYIPKNLISIPALYLYEPKKEKLILGEVWPFFQKLLDDANTAQVDIRIISAYRSFAGQSMLKSAYKITYGFGANKFSADQGYSEHQLGTTIDFTTSKLGANFMAFEKTGGYAWLAENAYKYGFTLSYPKNNAYYVFEPWHWRFVGKNLALKLHNESKNFYDIAQREIDQYLISIFD